MLGKEITLFLPNGKTEVVICSEFRIGIEKGQSAIIMRTNYKDAYVVPLSKITRYEVKYIWIFTDNPFDPPKENGII